MLKAITPELDFLLRSLKDAVDTFNEPDDKDLELDDTLTYKEKLPTLYGTLKGKVQYTARRLEQDANRLEIILKHIKKLDK